MPPTNVLVTGGAGYIGSVLVEALLKRGNRVTVLDDFRYNRTSLLHLCANKRLTIVKGDVRDQAALTPLVSAADVLIPLAAIVGAPACDRQPAEARSVNVGAVKLLNRLRSDAQAVLFPVTNSGYGIGESGAFCTEESPLRPVSLYGRTKVEAESILLAKGNAIAFRLATAFGVSPRMRLDLLVNDFTYRAVRDGSLVLFEPHFKRNYIHIRDIARAFSFGLEHFDAMKNQVYNVGLSRANLSKFELCHVIKKQIPTLTILVSETGRDPDQRDYIVSNEKIERTGYRPRHSLDAGIAELIKAFAFLKNSVYDNL